MALKPSLVNLPVLNVSSNTLDLPSYLGYVNATPTANATYKLPVIQSYSEGAWTQIKNQSAYTITINDNDNNNVGQIPANGIGEYISSSIGWIDYSVNPEGVINSDTNITGYLNIGNTGPPPNTNPGDLTTIRGFIGNLATPIFNNNQTLTVQQDVTFSSGPVYNILAIQRPKSVNVNGNFHNLFVLTDSTNAPTNIGLMTGITARAMHNSAVNCSTIIGVNCGGSVGGGFQSPATLGTLNGLLVRNSYNVDGSIATGNITNVFGIHITDQSPSSLGAVTQFSGLEIDPIFSTQTTNAAIRIGSVNNGSSANYGIWINSNNTNSGSGIAIGTSGDAVFWRGTTNQLLTPGDWSLRHVLCSSIPTVAAGAGAGSSPTINITGSDHGFTVTLTTGTTATANATLFTVTFGATWTTSAPAITWAPGNATTATLPSVSGKNPFTSAVSTTTMTFTSNATALSDSTTYIFRFTSMR